MSAPLSKDDNRLAGRVLAFGCPITVPLRGGKAESPAQIPYLDLLSKHVRESAPLLPDAVGEFQGRPVMYFLDASGGEPDASERLELQHRLANRGDHGVLAVVHPGDLTLYPLNLDRKHLAQHGLGKVIPISDTKAPFLFQSVATGDFDLPGQPDAADPVFVEIKALLKRATQELVEDCGLDGLEVLSMTGRALFLRFLIDRRIVEESDLEEICPAALKGDGRHDLQAVFSNAERAAQTSSWLDETFNGDLLPLVNTLTVATPQKERRSAYQTAYAKAGMTSRGVVFRHLEAILRGWDQIQGATQLRLPIDWDDLNFRHIPIGVLSQVYEDFSHRVDQQDSLDRSVHYTPRALAKLLVDQALGGLESPHEARILDPACGAGVFLVLALRELVRLRWQHDQRQMGGKVRRPGKPVIQGILHRQICGFDVSESALRLAALGLYITVIELNEITRPPSEHHAGKAIQDLVLFDQRTETEKKQRGFVPGSLGDAVDRGHFDGAFDVVVGNPPWTRLEGEAKAQVDQVGMNIARRVLESRGLTELAETYQNPGGVPDVPFLWRAVEWAKPGGIIAFALEARLILSQSPTGTKARNALLQAISVTGILNGSDLEKTAVWGCMDQAWILLWARNEKPDLEEHTFHLLTPVRENELAQKGEFRLDYQSAYPVPVKKVIEYGWLCKALAIGTTLDVQVVEKLVSAAKRQSVKSLWKAGKKREQLGSGRGIDLQPWKSIPAPAWLQVLPIADCAIKALSDSNLFPGNEVPTFFARYSQGDPPECFEPHRTYGPENYRRPLVLIERAPGESRTTAKAYRFVGRDYCFTKNYFGYSGGTHRDANLLVALLHLIAHSSLFQHFTYMCSGQVGARRRIIDKQDIDAFPFPVLEDLSKEDRATALSLAGALDAPGKKDWKALDAFICRLFGLTKAEQQVVEDTVTFNGPYRSVREPAALPTPPDEARAFAQTLAQSLQPFFKVAGQKVRAAVVPRIEGDWLQPWCFVTLLLEDDDWTPAPAVISSLMAEATHSAASRVVMHLPEGGLIIGLVNKRRFWTRSRARLCALHIAREHMAAAFPLNTRR
jgi:hypothetical protein